VRGPPSLALAHSFHSSGHPLPHRLPARLLGPLLPPGTRSLPRRLPLRFIPPGLTSVSGASFSEARPCLSLLARPSPELPTLGCLLSVFPCPGPAPSLGAVLRFGLPGIPSPRWRALPIPPRPSFPPALPSPRLARLRVAHASLGLRFVICCFWHPVCLTRSRACPIFPARAPVGTASTTRALPRSLFARPPPPSALVARVGSSRPARSAGLGLSRFASRVSGLSGFVSLPLSFRPHFPVGAGFGLLFPFCWCSARCCFLSSFVVLPCLLPAFPSSPPELCLLPWLSFAPLPFPCVYFRRLRAAPPVVSSRFLPAASRPFPAFCLCSLSALRALSVPCLPFSPRSLPTPLRPSAFVSPGLSLVRPLTTWFFPSLPLRALLPLRCGGLNVAYVSLRRSQSLAACAAGPRLGPARAFRPPFASGFGVPRFAPHRFPLAPFPFPFVHSLSVLLLLLRFPCRPSGRLFSLFLRFLPSAFHGQSHSRRSCFLAPPLCSAPPLYPLTQSPHLVSSFALSCCHRAFCPHSACWPACASPLRLLFHFSLVGRNPYPLSFLSLRSPFFFPRALHPFFAMLFALVCAFQPGGLAPFPGACAFPALNYFHFLGPVSFPSSRSGSGPSPFGPFRLASPLLPWPPPSLPAGSALLPTRSGAGPLAFWIGACFFLSSYRLISPSPPPLVGLVVLLLFAPLALLFSLFAPRLWAALFLSSLFRARSFPLMG